MKLKFTFESMKLEDAIIAVPVGNSAETFRGVIKLNDSAAEIFELLKEETSEEEIITILKERYGNDPKLEGFVQCTIEYLTREGILD